MILTSPPGVNLGGGEHLFDFPFLCQHLADDWCWVAYASVLGTHFIFPLIVLGSVIRRSRPLPDGDLFWHSRCRRGCVCVDEILGVWVEWACWRVCVGSGPGYIFFDVISMSVKTVRRVFYWPNVAGGHSWTLHSWTVRTRGFWRHWELSVVVGVT